MGIALWACVPRGYAGALLALVALQLHAVWTTFPYTVNHAFFELWVLLALLLFRDGAVGIVRWLFLFVLFWAGVEKLGQGRYLDGELYVWSALRADDALGDWLRSVLATLGTPLLGQGGGLQPGVVVLIGMSWATVAAELALPGLLAAQRTRRAGVLATVGFLLLVDGSTHERSFVVTSLLCTALFLPGVDAPDVRGTARGFLAPVAGWAPVHLVASRVLGFSAWRLFGWGMYATPHESHREVRVTDCATGTELRPVDARRLQTFPTAGAAVAAVPASGTRTLVCLTEPRVDVRAGLVYGRERAWVVENGQAVVVVDLAAGACD